jgi:hypothetical protein
LVSTTATTGIQAIGLATAISLLVMTQASGICACSDAAERSHQLVVMLELSLISF